jgi:hypothetical protein
MPTQLFRNIFNVFNLLHNPGYLCYLSFSIVLLPILSLTSPSIELS